MINIKDLGKNMSIKEAIEKYFGTSENMYEYQYKLFQEEKIDLTEEQKVVLTYLTFIALPDELKMLIFEDYYSKEEIKETKIIDLLNGIINFGNFEEFTKKVIEIYFTYAFMNMMGGFANDNEN